MFNTLHKAEGKAFQLFAVRQQKHKDGRKKSHFDEPQFKLYCCTEYWVSYFVHFRWEKALERPTSLSQRESWQARGSNHVTDTRY